MKTNLTALMNLISEEEKNLTISTANVRTYSLNTYIEELDGRKNVIEDYKEEFKYSLDNMEQTFKKLSKLKATLYEKNNEFKLGDGRTIQQAIVDNNYLKRMKAAYEQLIYIKSSKKRCSEVTNSYFECKAVNFDIDLIRKRLSEIDKIIQDTDFEISKLNSIEFEI